MKITRKSALELYNTLATFKDKEINKSFSMYSILNTKKLMPYMIEIQDIQNSVQPSPEYLEVQQKELDLVNKYVIEEDKPVSVNNTRYTIKKDFVETFLKEKAELLDSNKEIIEEFRLLHQNVETLINEEVDIDLITINFDIVPDVISPSALETISPIIKNFGETEKK